MMTSSRSHSALETLAFARRIANHAQGLGVIDITHSYRTSSNHLGAVLADCVLQAGLNYRTVVRTRIERILALFPETSTLAGTGELIERGAVGDFLLWKHPEKIGRFVRLVGVMQAYRIEDTDMLHTWLRGYECRDRLLEIDGIGPKTVDYLSCLVGIDCIAVDRHVRFFAREAGVDLSDYEGLKLAFSYAADLLGLPRRNFDSWVWHIMSRRQDVSSNYSLF